MTEASALPTAPEPGAFARLSGVLFSPGKTFESIARKPGWDWLVPVVLLMGLALLAGVFINPKLDTDTAVKDTMKRIEANPNIPESRRKEIQERVEKQYSAVKSGWVRYLGP